MNPLLHNRAVFNPDTQRWDYRLAEAMEKIKPNKFKPKKDMVLIMFRHIEINKTFRYRGTWWKKITWKGAEDTEMLDYSEIPSEAIVGSRLSDITWYCMRHIIRKTIVGK